MVMYGIKIALKDASDARRQKTGRACRTKTKDPQIGRLVRSLWCGLLRNNTCRDDGGGRQMDGC